MWINEIRASLALRRYGFFLCLSNLLTVLHWGPWDHFAKNALGNTPPLCWPFWENCAPGRLWALTHLNSLLTLYALLSLGAALLFLRGKALRAAWGCAALALCLKLALTLQDYRLSGNFHYMSNLAWATYLFLPKKAGTSLALLTGFYVAAGFLKLNTAWLKGNDFISPPVVSGVLLQALCIYVVVLELVVVWGLFGRRRKIFQATFFQLVAFHAFSWHIVGYFYPTTMFCLLSLPWLLHQTGFVPRRELVYWPALAIFSLAQIFPGVWPGRTAFSGEGRILSETMLDAFKQCRLISVMRDEMRITDLSEDFRKYGIRNGCDSIVLWNYVRNLCSTRTQLKSGKAQLEVSFFIRERGESDYFPLVNEKDACASIRNYQMWSHNSWIRNEDSLLPRQKIPHLSFQTSPKPLFLLPAAGRIYGMNPTTGQTYWISVLGDQIEAPLCLSQDAIKARVLVRDWDDFGLRQQAFSATLDTRNGTLESKIPIEASQKLPCLPVEGAS